MNPQTPIDQATLVRTPGEGSPVKIRRFGTLVQVRGEATRGAVAVLEHRLASGTLAMPLHRHAETEVLHVLAGTLSVMLGDVVHVLTTGQSIVVPGGEWHTMWVGADEDEAAQFLAIVTPAGLERFYEAVAAHVNADGLPDMDGVLAACARHGVEVRLESIYDLVERHTVQLA